MPIVTIQSPKPKNPDGISKVISEIRRQGAKALGCEESNIWVIFQSLAEGHSIQKNDFSASIGGQDIPPIVMIQANEGRSPELREAFVSAIAKAIEKELSISSKNVWIRYQEMKAQDIWFDGHWTG